MGRALAVVQKLLLLAALKQGLELRPLPMPDTLRDLASIPRHQRQKGAWSGHPLRERTRPGQRRAHSSTQPQWRSCTACSSEERAAWCCTGGRGRVSQSHAEDAQRGLGRVDAESADDTVANGRRASRSRLGVPVARAHSCASIASTRRVRAGDSLSQLQKEGPEWPRPPESQRAAW